jgi:hypothetical protein
VTAVQQATVTECGPPRGRQRASYAARSSLRRLGLLPGRESCSRLRRCLDVGGCGGNGRSERGGWRLRTGLCCRYRDGQRIKTRRIRVSLSMTERRGSIRASKVSKGTSSSRRSGNTLKGRALGPRKRRARRLCRGFYGPPSLRFCYESDLPTASLSQAPTTQELPRKLLPTRAKERQRW